MRWKFSHRGLPPFLFNKIERLQVEGTLSRCISALAITIIEKQKLTNVVLLECYAKRRMSKSTHAALCMNFTFND